MQGIVVERGWDQQIIGPELSTGVYTLTLENDGIVSVHEILRE